MFLKENSLLGGVRVPRKLLRKKKISCRGCAFSERNFLRIPHHHSTNTPPATASRTLGTAFCSGSPLLPLPKGSARHLGLLPCLTSFVYARTSPNPAKRTRCCAGAVDACRSSRERSARSVPADDWSSRAALTSPHQVTAVGTKRLPATASEAAAAVGAASMVAQQRFRSCSVLFSSDARLGTTAETAEGRVRP